jgi:serine/threonine protein phosphatase 1
LGDYVDRGPDSVETLDVLMSAANKNPEWIFLRGNHDQMLLDLIEGNAEPNGEGIVLNEYGFSYERTTNTLKKLEKTSRRFQKDVHDFLKRLEFFYETDDFIFVHAILKDSSIPIRKKPLAELIWNYNYTPLWKGKTFIHGHLPVKKVKYSHAGVNINTECGLGGHLSGLELMPNNFVKVHSIGEDGTYPYCRFIAPVIKISQETKPPHL